MNKALMLNKIEGKKEKNLLDNMRKKEIGKEAFYAEKVNNFKKNLENGSLSAKEVQKQATELAPYLTKEGQFDDVLRPIGGVASDLAGRAIGGSLGALAGPATAYYGSILGGALGSGLYGYSSTDGDETNKLVNAGVNAAASALPINKFFGAIGGLSKVPVLGELLGALGKIAKPSAEILKQKQLLKEVTESQKNKALKGLFNKKIEEGYIPYDERKNLVKGIFNNFKEQNLNLLKNPQYNAKAYLPEIGRGILKAEKLGGLNSFANKTLPNESMIGKEFVSPVKEAINEFTAKKLAGSPEQKTFLEQFVKPEHAGEYIQSLHEKDLLEKYLLEGLKNTVGTAQVGISNVLRKQKKNN